MRWLITILILAIVLIAECNQQILYICPDNTTVNNPDLCSKPKFSADNIVVLTEKYPGPSYCNLITPAYRYDESKCLTIIYLPSEKEWNWCKQNLGISFKIINLNNTPYISLTCNFLEGNKSLGSDTSNAMNYSEIFLFTHEIIDMRDSHQITMCCAYDSQVLNVTNSVKVTSEEACKQFTVDSCINP